MTQNSRKKCANALIIAIILFATYIIIKYAFWTVFPFVFAFAISFFIRKIVFMLIKLTGLKVKEASLALLLFCFISFVLLLYVLIDLVIGKVTEFAHILPDIYLNNIEPMFTNILNSITSENSLLVLCFSEIKGVISSFAVDFSGKIAQFALNIPNALITATVTIIASFFICIDYDNIKSAIIIRIPQRIKVRLIKLKTNFFVSISKMLKCYLIILIVTFAQLFIGLVLLRVEYPFLLALLIAFADFLPLIGTGTVLVPWAIVSFLSGKSALCVGLFALYFIIIVVRNILEPKLIGKNIGLHPLITLAAMYIGLKIGGVLLAFMLPFCLLIFKCAKNDKQN